MTIRDDNAQDYVYVCQIKRNKCNMHDLHQQKISEHPHPTAQTFRGPTRASATVSESKCRPFFTLHSAGRAATSNRTLPRIYPDITTHLCYPPLRCRYHSYRPGTPRLLRGKKIRKTTLSNVRIKRPGRNRIFFFVFVFVFSKFSRSRNKRHRLKTA
ncbi:hypothetical protein SEUBUCD646_0H02990 [Saccharomyces eubayanus]|nr:hypothetical protein SEUBUCD646_0H02990 [Saccharomyces eubayanus]